MTVNLTLFFSMLLRMHQRSATRTGMEHEVLSTLHSMLAFGSIP